MIFQYRLFLGLGPNWTAIIMSYRYFSYEHFYVIYCRFWELDTDHDFFIGKENLIKYGNHSLTYRIVDRIFCQVYYDSHFLEKKFSCTYLNLNSCDIYPTMYAFHINLQNLHIIPLFIYSWRKRIIDQFR